MFRNENTTGYNSHNDQIAYHNDQNNSPLFTPEWKSLTFGIFLSMLRGV